MSAVRNLLLDLGGVLLDVDYGRSAAAFAALGGRDFAELYAKGRQVALFDAWETGRLEEHAFRDAVRTQLQITSDDAAIDHAWGAMLLGFRRDMLATLCRLRTQYRLVLYSNTNAIHQRQVHRLLQRVAPGQRLSDYFDAFYLSHACGYRKPAAASFERLLADDGIAAHETLFIDDSAENLQGAREAGLRTLHATDPGVVLDLPKRLEMPERQPYAPAILKKLVARKDMTDAAAASVVEGMCEGGWSDPQIAAMLTAWAAKGETVCELLAARRVVAAHARPAEIRHCATPRCGAAASRPSSHGKVVR